MAYEPTLWAKIFHSAPHVNITFHHVDAKFNPENDLYLESLGILASVPAGKSIRKRPPKSAKGCKSL